MESKILHLLTRSPMHIGSGNSVGAIDQPLQREAHTGYPVIPGSSLKGCLAERWLDTTSGDQFERGEGESAWLFGAEEAEKAAAGALLIGEGRLLAFPVRSARGGYAWIASSLMLRRAARDGVLPTADVAELPDTDSQSDQLFLPVAPDKSPLAIKGKVVLEDYPLTAEGLPTLARIAESIRDQFPHDPVARELPGRLLLVSTQLMSFFARTACEVAQHVKINPQTGTAEEGHLFNKENVPAETFFYAPVMATRSRMREGPFAGKSAAEALDTMASRCRDPLQIGADATTGLGWCSLALQEVSQ